MDHEPTTVENEEKHTSEHRHHGHHADHYPPWHYDAILSLLQQYPLPIVPVPDHGGDDCGTSATQTMTMTFAYGTAGFRYHAEWLPAVIVRVGIIAVLRSWQQHFQAVSATASFKKNETISIFSTTSPSAFATGVMVTASHNDATYNGVKIADPHGGLMDPSGEAMAVQITNDPDLMTNLPQCIALCHGDKWNQQQQQHSISNIPATVVHVGRDTRDHSPALAALVVAAIQAMGAQVVDHGIITTPMLHHAVLHANYDHHAALAASSKGPGATADYCLDDVEEIKEEDEEQQQQRAEDPPCPIPAHLRAMIPCRPGAEGYYDLLASSYLGLLATKDPCSNSATSKTAILWVDCACGVGYLHAQTLIERIRERQVGSTIINSTRIVPTNDPSAGPLNEGCGSEHVQKAVQPPIWYSQNQSVSGTTRSNTPLAPRADDDQTYCASLDGDADRIVFFSSSPGSSSFVLLDGDRLAVLMCLFMQQQFTTLQQYANQQQGNTTALPPLRLGIVQTAYANGASTRYLRHQVFATTTGSSNLYEPIRIAKTGVKYVHAAAHHHFDVGIYFEANGHGTILFGSVYHHYLVAARRLLLASGSTTPPTAPRAALRRLELLPQLVNQAVGDALSDLLLVDAILQILHWSVQDWISLYEDLPSRQSKVHVPDRTRIQTNENETACTQPAVLQSALDDAMNAAGPQTRIFVRPSGTEDVVRIYAEAPTQDIADMLAAQATALVQQYCRIDPNDDNDKQVCASTPQHSRI